MTTLSEIKKPIAAHLGDFEKMLRSVMKSRVPLLDIVLNYLYRQKGKQIRPLFVFLSAGVCGPITDRTQRAAALVELLHTATLVHDDVVDDSHQRRGVFSINALWKNKIAVLVGDYLLSRGLLLSLDHDDYDLLKIVSEATREMSEGELLQIEKARHLDISEEVYFEIITKKTASLIAACCKAGAASAGASPELQQLMHQFGLYTGIAFQIKDDLFDYQAVNATGKPSAIDIREKKMTLPLIFTLSQSGFFEKRKIIHTVRSHGSEADRVNAVIKSVELAGGIDYARERMMEYRDKALSILETLQPGDINSSLRQLVHYTIQREK